VLAHIVEQALAVFRHEGVEIDHLRDPLARAVGDTRGDHAAIAVPDQDDVAQVFEFQHAVTSLIWVSRSMSGCARWARSPTPV
jgi:hypothetical protein